MNPYEEEDEDGNSSEGTEASHNDENSHSDSNSDGSESARFDHDDDDSYRRESSSLERDDSSANELGKPPPEPSRTDPVGDIEAQVKEPPQPQRKGKPLHLLPLEERYPFRVVPTKWYEKLWAMIVGNPLPQMDLQEEVVEELKMITGYTSREVRTNRQMFLMHVRKAYSITEEEFLAIPGVKLNPLRGQLKKCFGFVGNDEPVPFRDFIEILSIFNNSTSPLDAKLKMAFVLHDFDGDNQIGKGDLLAYLGLVTNSSDDVELDLEEVATRILAEASSDPSGAFLSISDFTKVMGTADIDDKLTLSLNDPDW